MISDLSAKYAHRQLNPGNVDSTSDIVKKAKEVIIKNPCDLSKMWGVKVYKNGRYHMTIYQPTKEKLIRRMEKINRSFASNLQTDNKIIEPCM